MKRVWLRAAALALAVVGAVAGLTVYFSTEKIPRCLVSGVGTWRPPTDRRTHRYEVVILDASACFFDMDQQQRLVGALPLAQAKWLSAAVPRASNTLSVKNLEQGVAFVTRRGLLGVRVVNLTPNRLLYVTRFKGFTWNPRFGPDPPSHGLSLAPDGSELWVLDAPNSVVHVFDVRALPPRRLEDIRLSKPISGDESPCTRSCGRIGSLLHSADGRFVYVGDAGDVIDTRTREIVANLEALHNSRMQLEVDWVGGKAVFPGHS
ncbi:MAG: YncE family protein [Gaiellaceae bacterium]